MNLLCICVGVCACSKCEEDAQVGRARGRSGDGSWSSQTFCVSFKEGNMICQSTDVSCGCPNQKAMKHEMSACTKPFISLFVKLKYLRQINPSALAALLLHFAGVDEKTPVKKEL
ncbi:hypothetical protein EK904_005868, partial [Melospiza melodia maxima]